MISFLPSYLQEEIFKEFRKQKCKMFLKKGAQVKLHDDGFNKMPTLEQ